MRKGGEDGVLPCCGALRLKQALAPAAMRGMPGCPLCGALGAPHALLYSKVLQLCCALVETHLHHRASRYMIDCPD